MPLKGSSRVGWCLWAVLAGCVTPANLPAPVEYLDATTAATVTYAARPLIFAHERSELAAHSRDYLTLAAVSVDRSGAIEYLLLAYGWSTVDPRYRDRSDELRFGDDLTVAADDRLIRPRLEGHSLQDAGLGRAVQAPPQRRWTLNVYRTDLATLRYLAQARQITAGAQTAAGTVRFELWADERGALKRLVDRLEGWN